MLAPLARDHTAQVRFVVLTALMVVFVLALLAVVITITNLDPKGKTTSRSGTVRTYYIAAEEVMWDYAPSGINQITGEPFDSVAQIYTASGPQRIGTVYKKAIYRFDTPKPIAPQHAHVGILGPIIYAESTDEIRVVFKNNASIPLSILAEGVTYITDIYMPTGNASVTSASSVLPGDQHTYVWRARSGPTSDSDPSSSIWSYYSQADPNNPFAGLVGAIVITFPGNLVQKVDAKTGITYNALNDMDQEIFALFATFDENLSNFEQFLGPDSGVDPSNAAFLESNRKYSINGYLWGNLPVNVSVTINAKTRWYLIALNGRSDTHRPFWPGRMGDLTFSEASSIFTLDAITLFPGEEKILDMRATATGRTVLMCQVAQNVRAGMNMAYTIVP
ncbi:Ceruloplasmin precursor (Ferroxidase), putative [Acanthamoeba castellanii str. Neff]|uniref:Ceruloplasmin (Ferroxidase), putative n=1 Tax=Acanthamoeba castellanii (strain ATCC 30010 / Neff) TaxID=1257118 RepID=L8GMA2_ACACF|nr:Ceruloplasmin precursor (Ferroxidase), putative [Acanthamoeba castellanii str. Neff]ELR13356.1 Ceruloplasmin precursor (Ferroxidase), putative [Acanthamoeba castellanii str. Neff]